MCLACVLAGGQRGGGAYPEGGAGLGGREPRRAAPVVGALPPGPPSAPALALPQANSAILNTLLTLLNERLFDNGATRAPVPLLCLVGGPGPGPGQRGGPCCSGRGSTGGPCCSGRGSAAAPVARDGAARRPPAAASSQCGPASAAHLLTHAAYPPPHALPARPQVGASNELPESEELDALYDRFLIRRQVAQVSQAGLLEMLADGGGRKQAAALRRPGTQGAGSVDDPADAPPAGARRL